METDDTEEQKSKRKKWVEDNATFSIMAKKINDLLEEVLIKNETKKHSSYSTV